MLVVDQNHHQMHIGASIRPHDSTRHMAIATIPSPRVLPTTTTLILLRHHRLLRTSIEEQEGHTLTVLTILEQH